MNQELLYIDRQLAAKAGKAARCKDMTLTEYVEYVLTLYLNRIKDVKLVIFFFFVCKMEDTLFITQKEAAESMMVTEYMCNKHIKNLDGKEIVGWEFWWDGNLLTSHPSDHASEENQGKNGRPGNPCT